MNPATLLARIAHKLAALPIGSKLLLGFAVTACLGEWLLKRFAPHSTFYRHWKTVFEGIAAVWTTVILSAVYFVSVGPIGLLMRLFGQDPLDRRLLSEASTWRLHEPNPLGPQAAARHQF